MARLNLMDPANEAKSTGGSKFKEGNIRVTASAWAVHKAGGPDSQIAPSTVLAWAVDRLDEDLQPLTDDDGNPLVETLYFGTGGKALPRVHPGKADSPEDEEVEDLGDEIGTEGNTLFIVDETFRVHEKASVLVLVKSLAKAGWKEKYNRMWAPDYKGLVCFMGNFADPDIKQKGKDGKEYPTNYKVVTKIHTAPYEGKNKAAAGAGGKDAAAGKTAPKGDGAANPADAKAQELLAKLVADKDGSTLTKKAVITTVSGYITTLKVDPKLQVPILTLFKEDKWLNKHAEKLGYTPESDDDGKIVSVTFGAPETVEEE